MAKKICYLELPMTGDYPPCPECGDEQTIIVLPGVPLGHAATPRWIESDLNASSWGCPACYIKGWGEEPDGGWVYKQGVWYEEAGAEEVKP